MSNETTKTGRKVSFRLNADEVEMLALIANSPESPMYDPTRVTLSTSDAIRDAITSAAKSGKAAVSPCNGPHISEATAHHVRVAFGRIGNELNQLARQRNSGQQVLPDDVRKSLKEYGVITTQLQCEFGASRAS